MQKSVEKTDDWHTLLSLQVASHDLYKRVQQTVSGDTRSPLPYNFLHMRTTTTIVAI